MTTRRWNDRRLPAGGCYLCRQGCHCIHHHRDVCTAPSRCARGLECPGVTVIVDDLGVPIPSLNKPVFWPGLDK